MLVCAFLHNFARETAGAARTRLSLRPLFEVGGKKQQTPGETRRGIAKVWLNSCSPDGAQRNPGPAEEESRIALRSIRATRLRDSQRASLPRVPLTRSQDARDLS